MFDIVSLISNPFFVKALIAIFIISIVASIVGPILTSRGVAFLTAEVAHAVLGGAALGIFIENYLISSIDPLHIALLFGVISGLLAAFLGKEGRAQFESAIGMSLAMSMAVAVIFLAVIPSQDIPRVWGYLMGDILFLSTRDMTLLTITTVVIVIIGILFSREFIYIAFDEDGARAMGLNTKVYHYLSIFIASLGIVIATKALGSIIIYAIMIVPPLLAGLITNSYTRIRVLSFFLVLIYGVIGLVISFLVNIAPSGVIASLIIVHYVIERLRRR